MSGRLWVKPNGAQSFLFFLFFFCSGLTAEKEHLTTARVIEKMTSGTYRPSALRANTRGDGPNYSDYLPPPD